MTEDEEVLNEVIQRRGYAVVAATGMWFRVGDILPKQPTTFNDGQPIKTEARWYVVGISNLADMREQQKLIRRLQPWRPLEGQFFDAHFYRVLSD